jgi:hypothetical protein
VALAGTALLARTASTEPPPKAFALHGIARGVVVYPDGYFQWKPAESTHDLLGVLQGTTREFEDIPVEVCADRRVWTAAQRAAHEAHRVQLEVERGEDVKVDLKGDTSVARVRRFSGDTVYACAAKSTGRTVVYARASWQEGKREAALVKLVQSVVAAAKPAEDEVNGWLPVEVKTRWNVAPGSDLVVVDDGNVPDATKTAAIAAVRAAHAFVKRSLGGSPATALPPVVRITSTGELVAHLSGRGAALDPDANYLPWAGELFVTAHGPRVDAAAVARAAARQALHHLVGVADAEPLATGLARLAEAEALGAPAGSLLPSDEARAFEAVKGRRVRSWAAALRATGSFKGFGKDDASGLEAELWTGYLVGGAAPVGKASLAAWVAAVRKEGHADVGANAAYSAIDGSKSDAEFWAYWTDRAEPKKPPKPGK